MSHWLSHNLTPKNTSGGTRRLNVIGGEKKIISNVGGDGIYVIVFTTRYFAFFFASGALDLGITTKKVIQQFIIHLRITGI